MKQLMQRASIGAKMTCVTAGVTGFVLILVFGVLFGYGRMLQRQALGEKLEGLAGVLAHQGAVALAYFDKQAASDLLQGLDAPIASSIYTADGKPFVSVRDDSPIRGAGLPPRAPEVGTRFGDETLTVTRAVTNDGEHLGTVSLQMGLGELHASGTTFIMAALGLLIISCGLAAFLSSRWQRSITQPIEQLATTVTRIAESGDTSIRATVASRDEIGQLVGAVNNMLSTLQSGHLELLSAKRKAEQDTMAKGQFLANVSHDIRTPMNGVLGMLGLLRETELNTEQRDFADTAFDSGESLLVVINNILDFTRAEAGQLELEVGDFDLQQIVEEATEMSAEKAQAANLELACVVLRDVPTQLRGDAGRLRQVLLNLVDNAIHCTAAGEVTIHVSTEATEPEDTEGALLRFEVHDTGTGFDAQNVGQLFECFEQDDASIMRRLGGSGLGLAICKYLARLMGGEIGATSRRGQGSTFWFTARFGVQTGKVGTTPESPSMLRDVRVLVVDDNATNRFVVKHQLESNGAVVSEADRGSVALEQMRSAMERGENYDTVLIDMLMPGMDGIELAREIRNDPGLAEVPLVMLTSLTVPGHAEEARQAGVSIHLTKPVRQSHLVDCLCRALHGGDAVEDGGVEQDVACTTPGQEQVEPEDEAPAGTARPRVLVVDDNAVNQKLASMLLEKFGYGVDTVGNGLEAVAAVAAIPYAAILMDCQMPEMDGFEATELIRRREESASHIPIIAMTALAMQGDRERTLAAGMDDYISKPVQADELRRVLNHWLGQTPAPGATAP